MTLDNQDDSDDEETDDLEQLIQRQGTVNRPSVAGVTSLAAESEEKREVQDLYRKTMHAITSLANKTQEGTQMQEKVTTAITLLTDAQKRKTIDEPEEEEPTMIDEMIELKDDGHSVLNMQLRQKLKTPNGDPADWWDSKTITKITHPIVGANLHLSHIMPSRVNPRTIRRAHDQSQLMTTKALATQNSGVCGEKKYKYNIQTTDDDQHILSGGRNYTENKTIFETVESVLNYCGLVYMIRPWSFEGLALIRSLHHVKFFYGCYPDDAREQKKLLEKFISEIFSYNQRRGNERKFPATVKKCIEIAKETAISNGVNPDTLMIKVDPYCGRKNNASEAGNKKIADLEKEVADLKKKLSTDNRNRDTYVNYNTGNRGGNRGNNRGGFRGYRGGQSSGFVRPNNNYQNPNLNLNNPIGNQNPTPNQNVQELTRSKLQQTCLLFNSGVACDGSCNQKHQCSVISRPGHLCWATDHAAFEHV